MTMTSNPIDLADQLLAMAECLEATEYNDTAAKLRDAASALRTCVNSSQIAAGDTVVVSELAIALDPELTYYRSTAMIAEQVHDASDVSCLHPTDGPCGFALCELEKV